MGHRLPSLIVVAALLSPVRAGGREVLYRRAMATMGSVTTLTIYAADSGLARKAGEAAVCEVLLVDSLMSLYRPESELVRLDARAGLGPVAVSARLGEVLRASQEMARVTGGAFDVTVGALMPLWGLEDGRPRSPLPEEVEARRACVGAGLWSISRGDTVVLSRRGMRLDLGGIAKGYAADRAARALTERGISAALVDVGGTLVAVGAPPGEEAWEVALQHPREEAILGTIPLRDSAVSTSGDYERYVEIGGRRLSHLLDPRTGRPAGRGVASATVVGPSGMEADALSTALCVLGPEEGFKLLTRLPGREALLVLDRRGTLGVRSTPGWPVAQAGE